MLLVGRRFVDHLTQPHHVLQAVDHPRLRRLAVAPGAAGLLIVGFDALRQIQMRDEAHVRLVDAHAEGNRRHHDHAVLALEARLMSLAHFGREPRVIRHGGEAFLFEPCRGLLDLRARHAVDDARLAAEVVEKAPQLASRIGLHADRVADVGSIEAADETLRRLEL